AQMPSSLSCAVGAEEQWAKLRTSIMARTLAAGVLDGAISPVEASSRAHAIDVRTRYQYAALAEWRHLNEELGYIDRRGLSYRGRPQSEVETDAKALARSIVEGYS